MGLFELNNLGLSVCSPVEDFFLAVDEQEEGPDKAAVCKVGGRMRGGGTPLALSWAEWVGSGGGAVGGARLRGRGC